MRQALPSTSRSEPGCPLLTPCLACGVGFRSARCFSACGRFESFDSFDLKL